MQQTFCKAGYACVTSQAVEAQISVEYGRIGVIRFLKIPRFARSSALDLPSWLVRHRNPVDSFWTSQDYPPHPPCLWLAASLCCLRPDYGQPATCLHWNGPFSLLTHDPPPSTPHHTRPVTPLPLRCCPWQRSVIPCAGEPKMPGELQGEVKKLGGGGQS